MDVREGGHQGSRASADSADAGRREVPCSHVRHAVAWMLAGLIARNGLDRPHGYAPLRSQETLFILERAPLFGTKAGDVYQVIDIGSGGSGGYLQNVITFPPEGSFIVDSSLAVEGPQRVAFSFNAATLKLPGGKKLGLPPFGKGW